ncbi:hypothetical protein A0O34_16630 [Chryseobacterium glaciei]|uniref:Uncharacterized protein n=1 Tax=Chryseobacterium glaciei TaxID=1685010 RepID=A0A172XYE7_9FLAO|nr:hypothetical protein [Chryseobacterium glaciei]ANF52039.1 hypothetical protein A0O34_16630 [Chryseobacterium glaciei]
MEKNEITTKEELKTYFGTGKYPTQSQFSDFIDSYWHKEENIESQETLATVVNRNNKIPEQGIKFLQNGTTPSTRVELRVNPKTWSQWFGNMNPDHTGIYNQSFGYGALQEITTGSENVALGNHALWKLTTGIRNTVVGSASMNALKEGNWNVVVGQATLYYFASGTNNTAVGRVAMSNFIGGYGNTALGSHSGFVDGGTLHTQEYNYNTFLGFRSGYTTDLPNNLKGHNNVTIGANAPIGGNTNNKLVIHSSEAVLDHNITLPLIGGDFVERTLAFDSSLKVHRLQQADSAFTKNIVAKPDGTFGWEEKTDVQTSGENIATADLTNTQERVFTQNANFTWDTLGKPYYLKGLADQTGNLTQYNKVLRIDPVTKQVAMGDSFEVAVTIPDNLTINAPAMNVNYTVNHVYPDPVPSLPQNLIDLKNFMATIATNQYTQIQDSQVVFQKIDTADRGYFSNGVAYIRSGVENNGNDYIAKCSFNLDVLMPHDKNWVLCLSGSKSPHYDYARGLQIGFSRTSSSLGVQQPEIGTLKPHISNYGLVGYGINDGKYLDVKPTVVYTKVGEVLNITVAYSDGTTYSVNTDAQTFLGDYRFVITSGDYRDIQQYPSFSNIRYYVAP